MLPLVLLASQSPRRRDLLQQIGINYQLLNITAANQNDILEQQLAGENPTQYVQRVVQLKLHAGQEAKNYKLSKAIINAPTVINKWSAAPVLCADTTVELDGQILGKPGSKEHAAAMLAALSGRTHLVHTAVGVRLDERSLIELVTTEVSMAALSQEQIASYIDSGEPCDKAGAYAVQGRGAVFVKKINDSYSAVVGLPLYETVKLLRCITTDV